LDRDADGGGDFLPRTLRGQAVHDEFAHVPRDRNRELSNRHDVEGLHYCTLLIKLVDAGGIGNGIPGQGDRRIRQDGGRAGRK
jgi:hypothetical protein